MFRNLGMALSFLRELRGKSQARLAREAGIGKSQLSKYERGKELPKLDSLEKLLGALGASYLDLFTTLYFVDQRIASFSGATAEPSIVVWASGGLSPLSTDTEEAFAKVFRQLLTLHREVFRQVLCSESGTEAG